MSTILSPMVLAFALGIIAKRIKSDLKFPEGLYQSLTMYLLVAIGMKGGHKLSLASIDEVIKPALAAIALCGSIPLWTYWIMRKAGRMTVPDAAAMAAHYGSVSAVTFSTAIVFHESLGITYEGFMPSLLALMEIPAVIIAISLARFNSSKTSENKVSIKEIALELLAGKSSVLLIGFLCIGFIIGDSGWEQVAPLFDTPFKGILTLFLLEAGLIVGERLNDLKKNGLFLVGFGIVFPMIHAVLGISLGHLAGLSLGGATILGVLAASASYIAAPAACRVALPDANPSLYLTAALAITFPFNIIVGLPLYHALAEWMVW